jgi:hypothetical protein
MKQKTDDLQYMSLKADKLSDAIVESNSIRSSLAAYSVDANNSVKLLVACVGIDPCLAERATSAIMLRVKTLGEILDCQKSR